MSYFLKKIASSPKVEPSSPNPTFSAYVAARQALWEGTTVFCRSWQLLKTPARALGFHRSPVACQKPGCRCQPM